MKSIYGSKLYLASKRKDRIQAALTCLGNMELVQQLADDLDEEYQVPENLGLEEPKAEADDLDKHMDGTEADVNNFSAFEVDEEVNPQTDLVSVNDMMTQYSSEASSASQEEEEQKLARETSEEVSPTLSNSKSVPQSADSESIPDSRSQLESSIQIANTDRITAATQVVIEDRPQINLTILKSTLNSRADTAGVSRVSMKENELWIYYGDSTNLNNVMTDVIECLASEEYKQFEFNRLARSDNAVVFEMKNET
jgi:glucan-binding YG repeat protein